MGSTALAAAVAYTGKATHISSKGQRSTFKKVNPQNSFSSQELLILDSKLLLDLSILSQEHWHSIPFKCIVLQLVMFSIWTLGIL